MTTIEIDYFCSADTDMVMDEEIDLDALKSYSAPDILICGNCRFLEYTFKFGITNST